MTFTKCFFGGDFMFYQNKHGELLRRKRAEAGLTQQQVADALNLHRSAYVYYETGKTAITVPILIKLAEILHVNIEELLLPEKDT